MSLITSSLNDTILARVTTTLNGKQRGRGSDRKWYGRHTVTATIELGANYGALVRDSLNKLADEGFIQQVIDGCTTHTCDEATATAACFAIFQDLTKSKNGAGSSRPSPYTPYTDNGEKVDGVKVYSGSDANKTGTVYVYGRVVDFKVITPDVNGSAPKSTPKSALTEAKAVARKLLPVGQYTQYPLNGNWSVTPA